MSTQDPVEADYLREIAKAEAAGDNDRAHDLSVGLAEYRQSFKATGGRVTLSDAADELGVDLDSL
jgi:hypothetical protein